MRAGDPARSLAAFRRTLGAPRFELEPARDAEGRGRLMLRGRLAFSHAAALWRELRKHSMGVQRGQTFDLDMAGVESIDGGAMALLTHLRAELQQRGVGCELVHAADSVQQLVHMYSGDVAVGRRKRRRPIGTLDQLGRATMGIVHEVQLVLAFLGQVTVAGLAVVRAPGTANWRELTPTMERVGADATPIVVLINFLVGLVTALQSAPQLERFGASIFLADLIGLATVRELGPLMTAIIVCGRSGAAFAAELGSMKVNEEIDALRTMGFAPLRFLVLPRALALMAVMPLLTLIADAMGMLGGFTIATLTLDITPIGYLNETQKAVGLDDVMQGLVKSSMFGLAIALISCQQGLATTGGAEGVGRRTTAAVVTTLFSLILIDAAATIFFRGLGYE